MLSRISFGFHNPNHAAALVCALLPLCWGWSRAAWIGRGLAVGLFAALLLTRSRTGLIVATLEWAAWWAMRRGNGSCKFLVDVSSLAVFLLRNALKGTEEAGNEAARTVDRPENAADYTPFSPLAFIADQVPSVADGEKA